MQSAHERIDHMMLNKSSVTWLKILTGCTSYDNGNKVKILSSGNNHAQCYITECMNIYKVKTYPS